MGKISVKCECEGRFRALREIDWHDLQFSYLRTGEERMEHMRSDATQKSRGLEEGAIPPEFVH